MSWLKRTLKLVAPIPTFEITITFSQGRTLHKTSEGVDERDALRRFTDNVIMIGDVCEGGMVYYPIKDVVRYKVRKCV